MNVIHNTVHIKKAENEVKIKSLEKQIDRIKASISLMNVNAREISKVDCKHENKVSTGLIKMNQDKQMKEYKCQNCLELVYFEKVGKEDFISKMKAEKNIKMNG